MKKLLGVLLAIIMVVSISSISASALVIGNWSGITVLVNGDLVQFDTSPIFVNGRVMVPMRAVLERMGVTVFWDQENYGASVGLTKKDALYILDGRNCEWGDPEGFDGVHMYVNDQIQYLDVQPQVINNRMLAPVRALAEAFGAEVYWDDTTQTVSIYSDIPYEVRLTETDKANLESFTFEQALSIMNQSGYIGAPTEAIAWYDGGKKYWLAWAYPLGTTQEDVDRYYNGQWDNFHWTDVAIACDGTLTAVPEQ